MVFSKPMMKIAVLVWVDILAGIIGGMIHTYLTDVWELVSNSIASKILYVFWCIVLLIFVVLKLVLGPSLGYYWVFLFSNCAYFAGFSILTVSSALGNCSEYKAECMGVGQKIILYLAFSLSVLGMSGHVFSFQPFLKAQSDADKRRNELSCCTCLFNYIFVILLVPMIGVTAIYYIKPWSIRFGIAAIYTLVSTIIFMSDSYSRNPEAPQRRPLIDEENSYGD